MRAKLRKNLLWIWLIIPLLVSIGTVSIPVSAGTASLSAPVITDTTLTPSETFYIDITVANVEHLWGYQFVLFYNTSVLTATGYKSYDPFTKAWPCQIDDTLGYVSMAYSMPSGENVGFSTVDPTPIARIDFKVDALGTSNLTLSGWEPEPWTKLSSPTAQIIPHDTYNGFFANVVMENHDLAITDVTASPTSVLVNHTVTLTVTAQNQGDFEETFNVSVYYDSTLIETQTEVTLSAGASKTLTFTWDTTGVTVGNYTIKAEVTPVPGEIETVHNTFIDGKVTVTMEEASGSSFALYAVAGMVIAIAAVTGLIYFLRSRKPT